MKPFLYNGGEGKKVPLSKLIRLRNKERPPDKRLLSNNKKSFNNEEVEEEDEEYKLSIRWRIANFFRRLKPNGFRRRSNDFVYPQHFIHGSNNIIINLFLSDVLPTLECEYREVCWSISERGSVGETALHLCLV